VLVINGINMPCVPLTSHTSLSRKATSVYFLISQVTLLVRLYNLCYSRVFVMDHHYDVSAFVCACHLAAVLCRGRQREAYLHRGAPRPQIQHWKVRENPERQPVSDALADVCVCQDPMQAWAIKGGFK